MRNKIGLLSWFLGICCIAIGCVSSNSWIGASEDDVITRFGIPEKSYETDDKKYLVYNFTNTDYAFNKSAVSIETPVNAIQSGYCEGIFIISGGLVEKLITQGTNCPVYQIQK